MFRTKPFAVCIAVTLVLAGCTDEAEPDTPASPSPTIGGAVADTGLVDVGGYELAYQCAGDRADGPTVVLEAGYDSAGTSTWFDLQPEVAEFARVCTYDRAGVGTSGPRPSSMEPVTGEQIAGELHAPAAGHRRARPVRPRRAFLRRVCWCGPSARTTRTRSPGWC